MNQATHFTTLSYFTQHGVMPTQWLMDVMEEKATRCSEEWGYDIVLAMDPKISLEVKCQLTFYHGAALDLALEELDGEGLLTDDAFTGEMIADPL